MEWTKVCREGNFMDCNLPKDTKSLNYCRLKIS
jgi:hypothetical protein